MRCSLKAALFLTITLVCLSPAGVLADKTDKAQTVSQNSETEAPASTAPDSSQNQSGKDEPKAKEKNKDKGKDKDQENGKSYSEETDQKNIAQPSPSPPPVVLIDSFRISVSDIDDKAVERATVKITWINGGSSKKITDIEGVATFRDLPVTSLSVQITAKGHRSHVQPVNLSSDDNEVAVVLKKRD